jgi:hypothetical protein
MFIAVVTSVKLYLNLSSNINDEIMLSKEFYILSVNIFKMTHLQENDRKMDSLDFLNETYSAYVKLIETSSLLQTNIKKDELAEIDLRDYLSQKSLSTSSKSTSTETLEEPTNIIVSGSTRI